MVPEEEIVSEGVYDKNELFMYFISKGDCYVSQRNQNGREEQAFKLLNEGDNFGEISLIYNCPRTATVRSRNYNELAHLSYDHWRELCVDFPKFLHLQKLQI